MNKCFRKYTKKTLLIFFELLFQKLFYKMEHTKKLLFKLSIGATLLGGPIFAEENSGWYATGSIGGSKITDLEYVGSTNKIQFDAGLGLDLVLVGMLLVVLAVVKLLILNMLIPQTK